MTPRSPHPRNVLLIGTALIAMLVLGACNTMRGVGKDTEAVGDKIQDEAEQHMDDEKKDDGREGESL
ncbi:entericidin A/B family lipoprotein [Silanimonas sp.]|uniref:entericidin A/B family lipoprotein n=1 Tax=Silanimonas sp. TaxID=1929290 RepID=UPI0022BEFF64|nr:entericidin A/B family lipoprotein [Silanimonas sp.]MCZ8114638.1 entericidin A/B family lipoprotein [Silanimonas sp.]